MPSCRRQVSSFRILSEHSGNFSIVVVVSRDRCVSLYIAQMNCQFCFQLNRNEIRDRDLKG